MVQKDVPDKNHSTRAVSGALDALGIDDRCGYRFLDECRDSCFDVWKSRSGMSRALVSDQNAIEFPRRRLFLFSDNPDRYIRKGQKSTLDILAHRPRPTSPRRKSSA